MWGTSEIVSFFFYHLSTFWWKDALNALPITLNVHPIFKQHPKKLARLARSKILHKCLLAWNKFKRVFNKDIWCWRELLRSSCETKIFSTNTYKHRIFDKNVCLKNVFVSFDKYFYLSDEAKTTKCYIVWQKITCILHVCMLNKKFAFDRWNIIMFWTMTNKY